MNNITIELSAEDRARLDKIVNLLEALLKQEPKTASAPTDPVTEQLRATVEQAKNALGATEGQTPSTTQAKEEPPTAAKEPQPQPTKTVSRAELATKVREMMTKGFKEETKAIVKEYAPNVPGVPEDKVTECYERLVALEG